MNLRGFFPKFYNLTPPTPPKFIRNIKISAFGLIISKWQWVFIVRLLALSTQFTISVKLYVKHCGVHGKKLIVKFNSIQQIYTFSKHENWPHSINFRQPGFRDIFKKRLSIQKGYFVILKKNQRKLSAVNISLSKVVSFMLQL